MWIEVLYETMLMYTNMLSSSVPLKNAACKLSHLFPDLLMGYLLEFGNYCCRGHAMTLMAPRCQDCVLSKSFLHSHNDLGGRYYNPHPWIKLLARIP